MTDGLTDAARWILWHGGSHRRTLSPFSFSLPPLAQFMEPEINSDAPATSRRGSSSSARSKCQNEWRTGFTEIYSHDGERRTVLILRLARGACPQENAWLSSVQPKIDIRQ